MSHARALVLSIILVGFWPGVAAAFSMSVSWKGTAKCFDSQSPIIRLSGVPKKTTKIEFHMTDLDAPDYPHGGGTVAYAGQKVLPKGAFSYRGPCPPAPHRYRWTAKALDANGAAIGTAQTTVRFSQ
jgi:phosphatidylethanolamine-binding protein (PEBP) family uncharacterized protein